jgi:tetratricopeptide (TPR) repeat protein
LETERSASFSLFPLSDIYLKSGYVSQALELMHDYLEDNPEHVQARRHLGKLYYDAQRPDKFLENMEVIANQTQKQSVLKEVEEQYLLIGKTQKYYEILKKRAALGVISQEDYIALVNFYAQQEKYRDAAKTLRIVYRHYSHHISAQTSALTLEVINYLKPNDPVAKSLRSSIQTVLYGDNLTDSQKSEIAVTLLLYGYKKEAEKVFHSLAEKAGPESSTITFLLYIWGIYPLEHQKEWIVKRVLEAPKIEKEKWFYTLEGAGQFSIIFDLVKNHRITMTPAIERIYLEVLASLRKIKELKKILEEKLATNEEVSDLRAYAQMAEGYDLILLEQKFHKRILQLEPNTASAHRRIGIYAFEQEQLAKARKHLLAFHRVSKGDYLTYYYLAEIYREDGEISKANALYDKAYKRLKNKSQKSLQQEITRVFTLYRVGKEAKAFSLLEKLLKSYPSNVALRADAVDLYLDARKFEEAEEILEVMR